MSEYYGTPAASSDFLAHYGVKGMKWGVRKFAKDVFANPSNTFNAYYGPNASKKVSPRKMQKHYNALDQSRANINQRGRGDSEQFIYEAIAWDARKKANDPHFNKAEEEKKHFNRQVKNLTAIQNKSKQMDNISEMQKAIAKAATRNGYDGFYTSVTRSGSVGIPTKMNGTKVKYKKSDTGKPRDYYTLFEVPFKRKKKKRSNL